MYLQIEIFNMEKMLYFLKFIYWFNIIIKKIFSKIFFFRCNKDYYKINGNVYEGSQFYLF